MTMNLIGRLLFGALAILASQTLPGAAVVGVIASTQPAARVEYWQQRQDAIAAQLSDVASMRAVKLVFVGRIEPQADDLRTVSGGSFQFLLPERGHALGLNGNARVR
jgi:hypothetical protein